MIFNASKLKGLMAENGFTNEKLSQVLDISHVYISDFRNGKRQPSIDIVNKMIEVFKLENFKILFN